MSEDKKKDFTDPPPPTFREWADEEFEWFKYFWTLAEFLKSIAETTSLKVETLKARYYNKKDHHDPHLYWCCQVWKMLANPQPLTIESRTLAQVKRSNGSRSNNTTNETTKEETPEENPQNYPTDEEN